MRLIPIFASFLFALLTSLCVRAGTLEELVKSGVLPALPTKARSITIVDSIEQGGQVTHVFFTEREPQSHTSIHMHDFSSVTCMVAGEMTLYLEGKESIRKVAGDCYYMPSGQRMIGFNSGRTIAKFYDFFKYTKGGLPLTVIEEGCCDSRLSKPQDFCSGNPYLIDRPYH